MCREIWNHYTVKFLIIKKKNCSLHMIIISRAINNKGNKIFMEFKFPLLCLDQLSMVVLPDLNGHSKAYTT